MLFVMALVLAVVLLPPMLMHNNTFPLDHSDLRGRGWLEGADTLTLGVLASTPTAAVAKLAVARITNMPAVVFLIIYFSFHYKTDF